MSFYKIKARARIEHVPSAAEISIYADIGESFWAESVSAADFVRELGALDAEELHVRINSYGGSVPDGIAIHNALRRKAAEGRKVITHIDGVAYSIASLIAMSGDEIRMAENAMLMIHAPWATTSGNAEELREQADVLDKWAAAMQSSYERVCGDAAAVKGWLTDGQDHYFTAEEALAAHLIHTTESAPEIFAAARARAKDFSPLQNQFPTGAATAPAPVPAVDAAFLRGASKMDGKTVEQAPACGGASNPAPDFDRETVAREAAEKALAADRQRRAAIAAHFAPFAAYAGAIELRDKCADDAACTTQAAAERLLAHLAKGATPTAGSHVITVEDAADKRRKAAENALLARAGLAEHDSANPMRGMTLGEVARDMAVRAGIHVGGMDRMQIVAAAFTHSSSDFPAILSNVAQKAMLKGYTEAEETFQKWTREGTLSDFRPAKRVDLGFFGSLPLLPEGAEYSYGTIGERGEQIVLATYGKKFSITRQAIINDDLDAFTRIPLLMGRAAIRTVGDLVYAVLTQNATMSDGKTLFHADHKNLLTGSAITTASIDEMQAQMALQELDGQPLNIGMKYLLVPRTLRGAALTVLNSEFEVAGEVASGKRNNTTPNTVRGTFEVISDARLDKASKTAWYGVADPAMFDGIEVAYLDGNSTPYLEQKDGWDVDGVEFKVRMDAGVAPIDFRTLAKNPGA